MVRSVRSRRLSNSRLDASDAGITLMEAVISITLIAVLLIGTATVLANMMVASAAARRNQQSADLLSEAIEEVRSLSFEGVANNAGDATLTGGNSLLSSGSYDPDGAAAGLNSETALSAIGGGVNPHYQTVTRNNTKYEMWRTVTLPKKPDGTVDTSGVYRRVTVVLRWQAGGQTHTRRASTFVTHTRRGLPLPEFDLNASRSIDVTQNSDLVLPLTITNSGARDSWALSASTSPSRSWTWTWYVDTGTLGTYESGVDTLTSPSSGLIETDETKNFLAITTISAAETPGRVEVSLTATSEAQPEAESAVASVEHTVDVIASGCASCATAQTSYLHAAEVANTSAPTGTTLGDLEAVPDGVPGYTVEAGGNDTTSSTNRRVLWQSPAASATTTFNGTAKVRLFGKPPTTSSGKAKGSVTVYVIYDNATGGRTTAGSATFDNTNWSTADGTYSPIDLNIPVNFALAAGKKWEVRAVVNSAGGYASTIYFMYGNTSHIAYVDMPVVA